MAAARLTVRSTVLSVLCHNQELWVELWEREAFKDGHIEVKVIREVAIPKLAHATDEKRLALIWSVRKL